MILINVKKHILKYGIFWILLIAFMLRVYVVINPYYGPRAELYRDIQVMHAFLHQHAIPLLGPESSLGGLRFGPVYYYILVPFAIFPWQPQALILASTFFSVLEIFMLYFVAKSWFTQIRIALLSAGLAAITVFDVQTAFYISNPNPMPFFTLLLLYCLTALLKGSKSYLHAIAAGISFGILTQLHTTAFVVAPIVCILGIIFFRSRTVLKQWFLFIISSFFTYAPYFFYELHSNFANTRRLINLGGHTYGALSSNSALAIVNFVINLFLGTNIYKDPYLEEPFIVAILFITMAIIARYALKSRLGMLQKSRLKDDIRVPEGVWLAWCWCIVGVTMFLFYQKTVWAFYFLVMWPLPLLFLAWGIIRLLENKALVIRLIFVAFLIVQSIQLGLFYDNLRYERAKNIVVERFRDYIISHNANTPVSVYGTEGTVQVEGEKLNLFELAEVLCYHLHFSSTGNLEKCGSGNPFYQIEKIGRTITYKGRYQILDEIQEGDIKLVKYERR